MAQLTETRQRLIRDPEAAELLCLHSERGAGLFPSSSAGPSSMPVNGFKEPPEAATVKFAGNTVPRACRRGTNGANGTSEAEVADISKD
jgi:hypothetical protein